MIKILYKLQKNESKITKTERNAHHNKEADIFSTETSRHKSGSFFATPGKLLKEIHSVAGYHEISSEQIWEKASYELSLENGAEIGSYITELKSLESARPNIVRQHS